MDSIGNVTAIALRLGPGRPMSTVSEAVAAENSGLDGDQSSSPRRGITFISARQWQQTMSEMGIDLPWHTRRANVLIDCDGLADLIGKTITLGEAEVRIHAETKPCQNMDQQYPGLLRALAQDCRGGVYGQVIKQGRFKVGDPVVRIEK